MKQNIRKIVMLSAALSALTAFPAVAHAADEAETTSVDETCIEYIATEDWDDIEMWGTDDCERYTDDGTNHCCDDVTTALYDCELYFDTLRSGDVDENGKLQVADAVLLARYIAEDESVVLSPGGKLMADANSDNYVDAKDLVLLLRGLSSSERDILICVYDADGNRIEAADLSSVVSTTTTTTTTGFRHPVDGDLWIMEDGYWKSEYQIGEELDILNARLYGCGTIRTPDGAGGYTEICWDIFGETTLGEHAQDGFLKIDTSEFDNTKAGTYTIYLTEYENGMEIAKGSFQVTVLPDGNETKKSHGELKVYNLDMTDEESMGFFGVPALKTVYQIGEKLDLSNLVFIGSGTYVTPYGNEEYWDIFPPRLLQDPDYKDRIRVDSSEFDSTKPGTYTIRLTWVENDGYDTVFATGSFTVTVVPEEPLEGTQCCETTIVWDYCTGTICDSEEFWCEDYTTCCT